jgi:hypothetical protein
MIDKSEVLSGPSTGIKSREIMVLGLNTTFTSIQSWLISEQMVIWDLKTCCEVLSFNLEDLSIPPTDQGQIVG